MFGQQPTAGNPAVSKVFRPLGDAAGWMKLVGIASIVYGVLFALTIIGLIFAWLPIWMGVLLNRAANDARAAVAGGDEDSAVRASTSLRTIFIVQGVLVLIGIAFFVLSILLAIGGGLSEFGT